MNFGEASEREHFVVLHLSTFCLADAKLELEPWDISAGCFWGKDYCPEPGDGREGKLLVGTLDGGGNWLDETVLGGKGWGIGGLDWPDLKKSVMDIGPELGFGGFDPATVVLLKKKGKTGAIAQLIVAMIVKIRMKVFIFIFIDFSIYNNKYTTK